MKDVSLAIEAGKPGDEIRRRAQEPLEPVPWMQLVVLSLEMSPAG